MLNIRLNNDELEIILNALDVHMSEIYKVSKEEKKLRNKIKEFLDDEHKRHNKKD